MRIRVIPASLAILVLATSAAAVAQVYGPNASRPASTESASTVGYFYRADQRYDKAQRQLIQADFELSRKSKELATQYGAAKEEAKKSQLRSQLRDTLEKQFQLQQQRRQEELLKIEERLKTLRELMQKRNDARQAIIDRRLDQLLRDAEGLGWNAPGSGDSTPAAVNPLAVPTPPNVPAASAR